MAQQTKYEVIAIENFKKELKRVAKKYPTILENLAVLITALEQNPSVGTSLGSGFFKIRLAIAAKGKGKSGGARVITNIKVVNRKIYLVSIYDKSTQETITAKELTFLLQQIPKL